MQPFRPRALRAHGVESHSGWSLKVYSITHDARPVEWPEFADGLALARSALPMPARTEMRPGVGFVLLHRGASMAYLVLGWWDRVNELPIRVFVRGDQDSRGWRPAEGAESVCVWDLEVLWYERESYVRCVMTADDTPLDERLVAYLSAQLTHDAEVTAGAR